ncbi:hypothetical protein ACX4M5_15270 [Roseomonas mucosa]|nr:hypothetical protein [Roseomonas mucosa]MBS5904726.1 hypothetical protein [Acetobacteraceae bacterium]HWL81588.1 hypothetical protein [Roseomonas sp.]MDT8313255.1 hypothetical protein [Roseomonas mucosa]MDT8349262.1 hypothetical protein [Roseomonas mucosa]MDT8359239.1 hypothetical protein [Roseomonas mucosa]
MQAKNPRWIVLVADGRYSTIGRHREPDADDIARIEDGLRHAGVSGWLAIMSQSAYSPGLPEVVEVRPLGDPSEPFETGRIRLLARLEAERQTS